MERGFDGYISALSCAGTAPPRILESAAVRSPRSAAANVSAQPIHIANNVWIGFDVCVLPGVSIGEGSVIGARSVVNQDVRRLRWPLETPLASFELLITT